MALAEGLIEEIAAGLCRFSYLHVIARALPRGWSAMRK
jgi:TolB-like protein